MRGLFRTGRTVWTAVRMMVILTIILGVAYPLFVTGVGQVAFGRRADGSLLRDASGTVVGSSLIGQSFSGADGNPLAQYFQPRPSAAGDGAGYDAARSSGSNLGPQNADLIAAIAQRKAAVAAFNGVSQADVPVDAVTASGSGLDPDISPAYADIQIARVAQARGLTVEAVRAQVDKCTTGPDLGYIGQARVNVVKLNLALDQLAG